MLGSPQTRARCRRLAQNRARFKAGFIYRPQVLSFCTHSFIQSSVKYHLHFLETEFSTIFDSTTNKKKCFLYVGDHFILGDELPITRSTTARAIICLKKIVFNTRLDLS